MTHFRLGLCALVCSALASSLQAAHQDQPKAVIAYVFVKDRVLAPNEIDAAKLTTINYAFANVRDGIVVEGFAHDAENFATLNALKGQNPQLKVLVSVGGWTWSGRFSDVSVTKESRSRFVESAVAFVKRYQLDGLDIDWEYPGMTGMGNRFRPEDKQNYTALLKQLRHRFNQEEKTLGRHLLTSVATGGSTEFLDHTEMNEVQKYVDTVNLMSYDYYEPEDDTTTGHHAPLYTNPADPKAVSADASVKLYLAAHVPAKKIVLGVPFYGHAWSGVAATNNGLYQTGKDAKVPAEYRNIVGSLLNNGFNRYWDDASAAPYLYNASTGTFVSYEDVRSIGLKCEYVLKHKLGGIMFWDYEGDSDEALLNAINEGLYGGSSASGNSKAESQTPGR